VSLLKIYQRDPSRTCPFYTRGKACTSGCWQEPICVTEQPLNGWPWERLLHRARMVGTTAREVKRGYRP
jgi:hypothetical protein